MRILVADDDDMVRLVIREVLAPKGHTLEEARDGKEALQKCLESKFDLILLDHHMPGLSGAEAALAIRKHCADARIIVLTGSSRPEELEHLADLQLIYKPFSAKDLLNAL